MSESTREIKNYRGLKCLNCNHPLDISDKFCPNCGQKNTTKRLSLKDFVDEFLANFYAYDSKVRNTIIKLFTKPGKAAKEFIDGKRQTYANPFRFYLSVSLIYFIFSGLVTKFNDETIVDLEQTTIKKSEEKNQEKDSTKTTNDQLDLNDPNSPVQINLGNVEIKKDTVKKQKFYTEKQIADFGFLKRTSRKVQTYANFFDHSKTTYPPKILDSLKHEKSKWNLYLLKKTYQFKKLDEEDNYGKNGFELFFDYLLEKMPFILFISLPFLTIVFAVLYYRKKLSYAEHMVFVFNFMSFMFLLIFTKEIIGLITGLDLGWIFLIITPIYFYKSLRNFYQQSRWKTILKFVILNFLLPTTASFVALLVLLIGFLLY
ncbi:DUF3667 domain-containing protein [Flavobacterium azooxidireducens]|uniref:DUF3667 domain-containing protein n=1 Tax=Flavobacterium azooxidireducens TaxID=1871076 RepID=A0ABY4KKT8_9FLAO|nr:DUF3667 domain-containing protein [Flavobacterium azooxidireducens]UPQ80017.1 DUF3667 domain-containing protein [Flavobacterium azooxidireducens]